MRSSTTSRSRSQDVVVTDGAESGDNGWTIAGWKASTGTEVTAGDRYYLLENRQYVGYDHTLEVGPYQFDKAYTAPDHVERFPFQNGMLVWLVDQGYTDNNVSHAPGCRATPCRSTPVRTRSPTPTASSPSNRREPFDATFGLETVDEVCLHKEVAHQGQGQARRDRGRGVQLRRRTGSPSRRSTTPRWASTTSPAAPQNSVAVANEGVTATVLDDEGGVLTVEVTYPLSDALSR